LIKKLIFLFILSLFIITITACSGEPANVPGSFGPGAQEPGNGTAPGSDPGTEDHSPGNDPAQSGDPAVNDDPPAPEVFTFTMGDAVIELDQSISYVKDKLGEPTGVFEAPSCAFEGTDLIFDYSGVQFYTYPKSDNEDHIHTISFFVDTVRTSEGGIRLGSSVQAVLDAYGDDYEYSSGMYTYRRGLTRLEFLTKDDIVIGISYGLHIDF